ncbi:MAG TPA: glycosyltransferase family 4 protein [Chitinispirillaceae bacterium]|nr:glycosyltransferase family 4 protein [Chitinispirillaceae bacterium]
MKNRNCKHLLIITDNYWPAIGGIEKTVFALSGHLPDNFKTSILTHRSPPDSKTLFNNYWSCTSNTTDDPNGTPIIPLKPAVHKRLALLPLLLWNIPGLRHFFPADRLYDLLYIFYKSAFHSTVKALIRPANIVHSFSTGWLARLTTEICIKENIFLVHSPAVHFGKWGDSPAQLGAYTAAQALICFSEDVKSNIISFSANADHTRIQVIPPVQQAMHVTNQTKRLIDEPYILFLGRRERHKGLHLLIEAFGKIKLPVKLVIAGPGERTDIPDSSIIDLGTVTEEDKTSLLVHCELFVLPSTDESFGIAFTEAMSCGKPVVAIDIPPVNEIVQNGITGILVPPGDTDALASAINKLLSDHELSHSMGEHGLEIFIERFAPAVVVPRIVELYDNVSTAITM